MEEHQHHQHHLISWGRRLIATMIMNLLIPLVQIYGGIISGSMALISDALHNLGDFISVAISYVALRMGQWGPSLQHTFGFKRLEVLAAVFNVAALYGIGAYLAVEGWDRLLHPSPIKGEIVIWIASAAFVANSASVWMLHSGARVNLNMKSAFLHMLTDALTSLGVAILGIVWLFRPWYWLDPIVTWIIVVMIFISGWNILKGAFLIFMNAAPPGIDLNAIKTEVENIEGIKEIHHLHVWQLSPESVALAAHIIVPDQMMSNIDTLSSEVRELLACRFQIDHPILQFETNGTGATGLLSCPAASKYAQPAQKEK